MSAQPEAIVLATKLQLHGTRVMEEAAAELRRLHEENDRFKSCLFQMQEAAKALAAPVQERAVGCACRWDADDNRVVTCERHQGWLEVIAEWTDRALEAEARLKSIPTTAQPCSTCEALARTVMMDQTSHDSSPQVTPQEKREWVGLTDEDKREYCSQDFGGNRLDAMDWAEARLREKNGGAV